jgi:predicted metalloprotease with PDZ domain
VSAFIIEQRDTDLIGTSAQIRYHIRFNAAARHTIHITMEIDAITTDITALIMPVWMPGSYKVRDMVMHQGNVKIYTPDGRRPEWHWTSKNRIEIATQGIDSIRAEYTYFANERGVRTSHVNRFHAYIMPVACLMYAEGRINEIHHVYLHHNRIQWPTVSTQLSPVYPANSPTEQNYEAQSPVVVGALSYDILADSPIEIGTHQVHTFMVDSAVHEVAVISNSPVDIHWLSGEIQRAVEVQRDFWGDLPYDRYVFMLLVGEGQRGGLEHLRCNVSAVEPSAFTDKQAAQGMMALLVHEFFHTWNIKRIRPREFGPFDYSAENYSSMLWLAEGFTSYYDDYLSYRSGFYTRDEFLNTLAQQHLGRLARVPGRFAMSIKDSSFLAWVKLYSLSPDMNNQFPSYYTKGGIIGMLLDMLIIIKSDGQKKLEDAMRLLWAQYKQRPDIGFTEQEIIEAIEIATGVSIAKDFLQWINESDELPYTPIFKALGLIWSQENTDDNSGGEVYGEFRPFCPRPQPVFSGWAVREENGRLMVKEVEADSPADKAGIGIDDEILSVNGLRVNNTRMLNELLQQNGIENPAELICNCDGRLFTTHILPIPQPRYTLRINPECTAAEKHLQEVWLGRPELE